MNSAFFFLLALLVAIGLVSPAHLTNANGLSEHDLLGGDPELKEWFAQLNEATRRNATWRAAHYANVFIPAAESPYNGSVLGGSLFNVTTAAASKKTGPNLEGYYQVDVRIGRGSTHTGTLRKGRMFQRIYSALQKCAGKKSSCKIEHIVYDTENLYKYRWSSDSYLKLTPVFQYFDVDSHPEIQDLGFRIIARIYELMTMQSSNCHWVRFPSISGIPRTYICSVANQVELAFPINGGVIQGVLNVKLEWSRKTKKGTYKCEGDTEGDTDVMMWIDFRDDIANAMKWPENKILPFVYCTDNQCFRQSLAPGHPWKENKDCTRLEWPLGCHPELQGPPNPKLNCPPSLDPDAPPGQPTRQNKALSIIYQYRVGPSGVTTNSWLFFPGEYGVDQECTALELAVRMIAVPGDADSVINPPWPGGTFKFRNLHSLECDYKNDGTNPGALFCQDWDAETKGPKNRKINCKADAAGYSQKAADCTKGRIKKDLRHKVVKCEW